MQDKLSEKKDDYLVKWLWEERTRIEGEIEEILGNEKRRRARRLKELYLMKCPKCGTELAEMDYSGVKIDKCTTCEGVWLDAGEMDAIANLERSALFDRLFSASIR